MSVDSDKIQSCSTVNAENSRKWRNRQKDILGEDVFNAKEAKRKDIERYNFNKRPLNIDDSYLNTNPDYIFS